MNRRWEHCVNRNNTVEVYRGLINVKNVEKKGTWKLPGSIDIYTLLEKGEPH
jgi:hypothetical protein